MERDFEPDETEEILFHWMKSMANRMNWDLSRRDPGPCECDNGRPEYCPVHGFVHDIEDPKDDWPEDRIRHSTTEAQRLLATFDPF